MSEIKLLPCPFCGGEAEYVEIREIFISRFVTCKKCGIETKRNFLKRKDAIKSWNKRKPMKNIVEQLEAEIESSDKYIREYDDSEVQKAFNKGMRNSLRLVKEEGGIE